MVDDREDKTPRHDLEYEKPPRRRVGFFERLNPTTTPQSVALRAARYAAGTSVFWAICAGLAHLRGTALPDRVMLAGLMVTGAIVGAVLEWQVGEIDAEDD